MHRRSPSSGFCQRLVLYIIVPILLQYYIICVVGFHLENPRTPDYDGVSLPSISFSEYWEVDSDFSVLIDDPKHSHHFPSDLISKKGDGDDYVISYNLNGLVLACESSQYPVQWTFPNPKEIQHIPFYTLHMPDYRKSSWDPHGELRNEGYVSLLELQDFGLNFLSVNITCSHVDSSQLSSSVHLFFERETQIEHQGATINVTLPRDTTNVDVILPCRPALPDATVTLYIQKIGMNDSTSWEKFHLPQSFMFGWHHSEDEPSFTFNPKTGFTLRNTFTDADYRHGGHLFKCVIDDGDDDEFVLVNVTTSDHEQDNDASTDTMLMPHSKLGDNAKVTVEKEGFGLNFKCCSGDSSGTAPIPITEVIDCGSAHACDIMRQTIGWRRRSQATKEMWTHLARDLLVLEGHEMNKTDCVEEIIFGAGAFVTCEGGNVDYAEQFVTVLNKTVAGATKNFPESSLNGAEGHNFGKAWISIGKSVDSHAPIITGTIEFFRRQNESAYQIMPPLMPPLTNTVTVVEWDGNLFEGERFHVMCFGIGYFYSVGAKMRINWKNKTSTAVEIGIYDEWIKRDTDYLQSFLSPERDLSYEISTEWRASLELESVDCFLPLVFSSKWEKVTYRLNIVPSTLPTIAGDVEETLYFELNEIGRTLNCHASGAPKPTLKITKDGKPLSTDPQFSPWNLQPLLDKNNKGMTTGISVTANGTVTFPAITLDVHGIYKCVATSSKGEYVKTIRVVVTDTQSHALLVFFGVSLFVLGLALFSMGGVYWFQRRRVQEISDVRES